jgi:hypothetical protein
MAIRLKNRWHRAYPDQVLRKTLQDHAGALGFIGWKVSLETARNLHGEGFEYDSDKERVGVITEFIAYTVHLCDRLAHARLGQAQRDIFVNALAKWFADYLQGNLADIAGPGDYRPPFVALLNRRVADYSELSFNDASPGYDLIRYLGKAVLDVMGETQTNRWVIDQVIEIDGPQVWEQIQKSFDNLFLVEPEGLE